MDLLPSKQIPDLVPIDEDERYQITDVRYYPYSPIVQIKGDAGCTGFLIGNNTVVTAGHCIYRNERWRYSDVYVKRNGIAYEHKCGMRDLIVSADYAATEWDAYDWGAFKVVCPGIQRLSDQIEPWWGIVTRPYGWIGAEVAIIGYPAMDADKPPSMTEADTMWRDDDLITDADGHLLYYKVDANGGQSGSPVGGWIEGRCCYAISTHGGPAGSSAFDQENRGVEFTPPVFRMIRYYKHHYNN